ncbi:MAG: outer membrane beta-barrel protein [Gammaproteobacteria bacterium]|nr:outer membrane beta-barrel protein [Gammaproteobacteria bacterium]
MKDVIIILTLFSPALAFAFNGFIDLGTGYTKSEINENQLKDGLEIDLDIDASGSLRWISFGSYLTDHIWLSLRYTDFGDTLSYGNGAGTQETYAYIVQAGYDFGLSNELYLTGNIGYVNWHSTLNQKVIIAVDGEEILWDQSSVESSGFSPKLGIGLGYRINETINIGFQYDYFHRLGDGDTLVSHDYLQTGDLAKASTGHSAVSFRVDSYSLYMRFIF